MLPIYEFSYGIDVDRELLTQLICDTTSDNSDFSYRF